MFKNILNENRSGLLNKYRGKSASVTLKKATHKLLDTRIDIRK